jgi:PAS domain S-box-containing protein
MKIYTKILLTTLPLLLLSLLGAIGTTYYYSHQALTDLAGTWLGTQLSEAVSAATEREKILHAYALQNVGASAKQARMDAGTAMLSIRIGEQGYVWGINAQGIIAVHPDPDLVGQNVAGEEWFQRLKKGQKGQISYSFRGMDFLAMYEYFPPWQWYILATDRKSEVYGVVNRIAPYVLLILTCGSLVLSMALMFLIRRLTAPLSTLEVGARQLGQGNLETRVSVRTRDELGSLAEVFNRMAGQLQETLTALKHSAEHFRCLIENSSDVITILNGDGDIRYESPSIERLYGYRPDELVGKNLCDLVHPDDKPNLIVFFSQRVHLPGGPPFVEFRFPRKDGSWRFVEAIGNDLTDDPIVAGVVINSRDITERKLAESEIRTYADELLAINRIITACTSTLEPQAMLERVLDETLSIVNLEGGAICLVRPDHSLQLVVQRAPAAAGNDEPAYKGVKMEEARCASCVVDGRPFFGSESEAAGCLAAGAAASGEGINFHAGFPLISQQECLGVLCLFTRTERKPTARRLSLIETVTAQIALGIQNAQLYQQVQQYAGTLEAKVRERTAQLEATNRELESFCYSVSHDLRAPLRGIDGWSLALLEDCADRLDEQGRTYLQRVRMETQRLGRLIDDLLELSRVIRTDMLRKPVDLSALVHTIAARLQEAEPDRQVEFRIQPGLMAHGDARLLEVMLSNLLGNAWKFTSKHPSARIEFGVTEVEGQTVYFVRDDGAGFDMTYARKLFGAFQRLHKTSEFPGSGVGLATVQRIVQRHGGRVWAEAEVEQGTTVYFSLQVRTGV